ncbi:hypothetical protein [Flagellimonas sp. S3867]|uniref:hypothetical protein n=1 Tax=Flagellimonas sp. S3867 TaxID=2768063 RepID=UPI001683C787|nr:hypothetical protein [Flagellimonas sp. S3867]
MKLILRNQSIPILLPLVGMGLFILLYVVAAMHYPGGSWANPAQIGFSYWNNYLCDLLDTYTILGVLNPARIYARVALLILCTSLMLLWYNLPKLFYHNNSNTNIMRSLGIISLGVTLLLGSESHDIIIRIAGVFGVVALILLFVNFFRAKYHALFGLGIYCLLIFFLNYYIYETGVLIHLLPIIQKITFLSFILWFAFLNISLYKVSKPETRQENEST